MTRAVASPCIDVCRFDPQTSWCIGCGRTLEEARQWRKLTPFHRRQIERQLSRRLAKLPGRSDTDTVPD